MKVVAQRVGPGSTPETYENVDQMVFEAHGSVMTMFTRKYPTLPPDVDNTMVHVVSIPLRTVWEWRIE